MNVLHERITATTAARLAATLNLDPDAYPHGSALPIGWHSVFGIPAKKTDDLSIDGLLGAGDVPAQPGLPRRMFGGARLAFHAPLHVGDDLEITSEVTDVKQRDGKAGAMTIVVVRLSYSTGGKICVTEDQDLVHLPAASGDEKPPEGKAAPSDPDYGRTVEPSTVMLFRYAAITFNSHRIHYDDPYAREVEGMPALMVQGRLLSVLTMGLLTEHGLSDRVRAFSFRSVRPVFADRPFRIGAKRSEDEKSFSMWVADGDGKLALSATAELA